MSTIDPWSWRLTMARNRTYDAIAGIIAAAAALGASELSAAWLGGISLVIAVADAIVAYTPGPLVRLAIETLGASNKPVLIGTVTMGALAAGALLGPLAGRYRPAGFAALAAFALLGALAGARDDFWPPEYAIVNATLAAFAGAGALALLLNAAASPDTGAGAALMPGSGAGSRRRFLALASGTAGAAALAAIGGRRLIGPTVDVEAQREAITLPPVTNGTIAGSTGYEIAGLSPLLTPNDEFYRIDTALVVPRIDASTWRLGITGLVDRPYELTFDELLEMSSIEESATLVCVSNEVGGSLAGNAIWQGVPLAGILERAGVQQGATQIVGRSVEGFTVGFPTEVALDGRAAMVAVGMNGEPLPARHGFPARLVVPGLYGYVSATKWLSEIELTTLEAFDAYWVPRGWAKEAPIKTQSRIDVPRRGQRIRPGRGAVAGVAWGGIRGISRVEVRIRVAGGPTDGEWLEARLSESLSESSWRQWVTEWDATPGRYVIEVRATDGEGDVQTDRVRPPAPDGATGYHRIQVEVAE